MRVIALGKSGEAYNIGNNKPEVSVNKIFNIFQKIYDKKIKGKIVKYPSSYPEDEPLRRCPDLTKSKIDLNYAPKIKLEKGLENYLNWAKKNYKY